MNSIRITLFGDPSIKYNSTNITECLSSKAIELLCFLLLNNERSHQRELIASELWGDHYTTAQSKKYLRKTLWQLQNTLQQYPCFTTETLIEANTNSLSINPCEALSLDIKKFEEAFNATHVSRDTQLSHSDIQILEEAIHLYNAELLEGWYQDWCLCERERYQQMFLFMVDKLLNHCEAAGKYELGLIYVEKSLKCDNARERTHRQAMRLYYYAGDRTRAIRQYRRCEAALKNELNLSPSYTTKKLYDMICNDIPENIADINSQRTKMEGDEKQGILKRLDAIQNLQLKLASMQAQLQQDIHSLQCLLKNSSTLM